jgi:pentatricopeptide repeat protein
MLRNVAFFIILLILFFPISEKAIAVEAPPAVNEDLSVGQAAALTTYLFQSGKFKVNDRILIEKLKLKIEERLDRDGTNPTLWFLKGRLSALLHGLHVRDMQKKHFSRAQIRNDKEYIKLRNESVEAYTRALDLDSNADAPMHLNLQMLGSISMDVFSDADMRVTANRKKLTRIKQHPEEHTTDIEDWEFKTYGNIVTAYVDEKRYDEALSVLEEMKEKFSYPRSLKEINVAVKRIKERKAAAMQKANTAVNDQAAKSKPQQTRKEDKPQNQKVMPAPVQAPQKQAKPIPGSKTKPSDAGKSLPMFAKIVIIFAIMAVVILCIFIYFRHKRK